MYGQVPHLHCQQANCICFCISFRADLGCKGCSRESRKQREAGDSPVACTIIRSILLSVFPGGLFIEPPGHFFCCCWSPTYFVSCQDPRGCGQQATSWRGVGCSRAVLQHATGSGWKDLLPPRHTTQDVFGPYLLCRR